ncbi:MAG: sulfatase-like hydrolase/transferase [Acidobacteria bacterium]|nr:sulfatase-like hydrolase/transferase [Acidobacteriota bacterium]
MRVPAGFLLLCLSILAGCGAAPEPPARPNFVYIMTDDHTVQMMSAYGSERASTPNLDRIAREGALFRNAFVTNALCAPSRATLLTGKYSHVNGQRSNQDAFDGSQQTFPKLLQQAGYQTAMIGKWHLKSDPTGFDYWNILPGQGAYFDPQFIEMGETKRHQGYVTDLITDFVIDWIRKRDKQKPFAVLYHHKAPHGPWQPDERHQALFADEPIAHPPTFDDDLSGRAEPVRRSNSRLIPELLQRWKGWGNRGKASPPEGLEGAALEDWIYQQYVKDYMRVVASVDENVGRFLDFLEAEGLAEDTVVIYTSDNGMFVGDHFMFDKRLMYEHPMRVPLAVRYPRKVKAGSEIGAFALNVDYAPTILDLAGVPVPADMQGRSLAPLLAGETPADWRKSMYYHYWEWPNGHRVAPHYGLRTERYKLIRHYGTPDGEPKAWELIDLEKDPEERRNVYDDPAYADALPALEKELERWRVELKAPAVE